MKTDKFSFPISKRLFFLSFIEIIYYFVLTHRKPTAASLVVGMFVPRCVELGIILPNQPTPRLTRYVPVEGPVGSVTAVNGASVYQS
jgi:hypothetical protein